MPSARLKRFRLALYARRGRGRRFRRDLAHRLRVPGEGSARLFQSPAWHPFGAGFYIESFDCGPRDAMSDFFASRITGILLPRVVESFPKNVLRMFR